MRRRLFTLCSAISMLLAIVLLVARIISGSERFTAQYSGAGNWLLLDALDGRLTLLVNNGALGWAEHHFGWSRGGGSQRISELLDLGMARHVGTSIEEDTWGDIEWFLINPEGKGGGGVTRIAIIPIRYLVLICLLLPLWWFALFLHSRARHSSGLCPTCGYNLTGNQSGVCPECGTPAPASGAA